MTAEFTAVGDLFELVIGTVRWPIVIIIGIVSAIYTAYGGLYVSIVTDQVPQKISSATGHPAALLLLLPVAKPVMGPGSSS